MIDTESKRDVHALDLPSIYSRPSAAAMLDVLSALATRPLTFKDASGPDRGSAAPDGGIRSGIPRYLTSIVASSLDWIADETVREQIWELASRRLSERAGRTAMPSMHRSFAISRSDDSEFSVVLQEPTLTADNLGHKTWSASFLLSRRLLSLRAHFPVVLSGFPPSDRSGGTMRALELGAGTGLLGLALAALFPGTTVHLTDLPAIVPNLAANLEANRHLLRAIGSEGAAFPLDWAEAEPPADEGERYEVVLVADPIYGPEHAGLLARAVGANLARREDARLVLELPLREAYADEVDELKGELAGLGLEVAESGEEVGLDDWEGQWGERVEVRCWWSVWRWKGNGGAEKGI